MKKNLVITLSVLMCVLLGACNSKSSPGASDAKPAGEQKPDQKQAEGAKADDKSAASTGTADKPSPAGSESKAPQTLTIPAGASLTIRLNQSLSTEKNSSGDRFEAALDRDVRVNDNVALPARSTVIGRIYHLQRSGKVQGRAEMGLTLTSVVINGKSYPLHTSNWFHRAPGTKKSDAKWIGGGAGGGALIGAIAGGKKGAAIGAAVGGGAGTAKVLATRGKPVALAAESRLTFKLSESLEVPSAGK
ncbi:MAG TPA: hypothetical protein VGK99_20795 [Acidobacteriota bacterium]|jgi:hypothetical protein